MSILTERSLCSDAENISGTRKESLGDWNAFGGALDEFVSNLPASEVGGLDQIASARRAFTCEAPSPIVSRLFGKPANVALPICGES